MPETRPDSRPPSRARATLRAIGALAAALAAWGALAPAARADTTDLLIGQTAQLSGAGSEGAIAYARGFRVYIQQANAEGGVAGRQIKVLSIDDGGSPAKARENAETLTNIYNVFAMAGGAGPGAAEGAAPAASSMGVPTVGEYSALPVLWSQKLVWTTRASYVEEARALVARAKQSGQTRWAVFAQSDSMGEAGSAAIDQAAQEAGLPFPEHARGSADEPSEAEVAAQKLVKSAPQAVLISATGAVEQRFLMAWKRRGGSGQLYALSFGGTLSPLGENEAQGLTVAQTTPAPWDDTAPLAREYRQALARFTPRDEPSYAGLEGYVAARVLVAALRQPGATASREAFEKALSALRMPMGALEVNFAGGTQGAHYVDLTMIGAKKKYFY
jgi:branched-chain amino acid transport system substrate-binding protein